MSDDFDLAHDKLPDLPRTIIGGDKSAAAWHPNSGPKVQHADLIARLPIVEGYLGLSHYRGAQLTAEEMSTGRGIIRDALAALGDTVPREQHERHLAANRYPMAQLREARAERDALQRGVVAATERAEAAEAERDARAHVIEQAPHDVVCAVPQAEHYGKPLPECNCWKSKAPAVSLALHDAELKAQALEEAAAAGLTRSDHEGFAIGVCECGNLDEQIARDVLRARSTAIREEAGK